MKTEKLIYEGHTEAVTKIMLNRQNAGSRNGFIFGQSGKGQAVHTTVRPSGITLEVQSEKNEEPCNAKLSAVSYFPNRSACVPVAVAVSIKTSS